MSEERSPDRIPSHFATTVGFAFLGFSQGSGDPTARFGMAGLQRRVPVGVVCLVQVPICQFLPGCDLQTVSRLGCCVLQPPLDRAAMDNSIPDWDSRPLWPLIRSINVCCDVDIVFCFACEETDEVLCVACVSGRHRSFDQCDKCSARQSSLRVLWFLTKSRSKVIGPVVLNLSAQVRPDGADGRCRSAASTPANHFLL